jgi:hypothetical protein
LNLVQSAINNVKKLVDMPVPEDLTVDIQPGDATPFSDFLSEIGHSVVKSQQELDQRSVEYLSSIKDRPYIPPTLFRIPKISAELKVALEDEKSTGLRVLLYSQQEKMSRLNQQSLKFEIAAVPPSADLLKALENSTPRIHFVFDRLEREKVFSALQGLEDKLKLPINPETEQDDRDRVLIWTLGQEAAKDYLILYAGVGENELGIWFLNAARNVSSAVLRFDLQPKSREDQSSLQNYVHELGQKQKRFLRGNFS